MGSIAQRAGQAGVKFVSQQHGFEPGVAVKHRRVNFWFVTFAFEV